MRPRLDKYLLLSTFETSISIQTSTSLQHFFFYIVSIVDVAFAPIKRQCSPF